MTRILITGSQGLLGYDLIETLSQNKENHIIAAHRAHFDITDLAATRQFMEQARPHVIIHAAAFTDVDACETKKEQAFQVNALGARHVAIAARQVEAKLIHISTDYVFDGTKEGPYSEEDRPNPISVYGASKLRGEEYILEECPQSLIVRTAVLYGCHGQNFVKTMLTLARSQSELRVVHDQWRSPTWTQALARQLQALLQIDHYGIYHAVSQGGCSWHEFAQAITREAGLNVSVKSISSAEFPRPAPRPRNSVLENRRLTQLGLNLMPSWQEALSAFIKQLSLKEVRG